MFTDYGVNSKSCIIANVPKKKYRQKPTHSRSFQINSYEQILWFRTFVLISTTNNGFLVNISWVSAVVPLSEYKFVSDRLPLAVITVQLDGRKAPYLLNLVYDSKILRSNINIQLTCINSLKYFIYCMYIFY